LGDSARAEPLVQAINVQAGQAAKLAAPDARAPRVLFLYARTGAGILAAGTSTEADAMIQLAGGKNVITEYKGYRPLTSEAAVVAAPEVILSIADGVASLGGEKSIYDAPGIALTPAGKNHRVVLMDSLSLLGFGPRTGEAVLELTKALYGDRPSAR